MICCIECFKDTEIRAIIRSLNHTGYCEVCGQVNVNTYDTTKDKRLMELLEGLIEIYTPVSETTDEMKKHRADFSLLKDELTLKWNLFKVDSSKAYKLIIGICSRKYKSSPNLFEEAVGIRRMYDAKFKEENSIFRNGDFSEFAEKIKYGNRFHLDLFNEKVFGEIVGYASTTYKVGEVFHRARLSDEETHPFPEDEMGAPPEGKSTDGRLNPRGISCLYLASTDEIALKEIRAGIHDSISLAKFRLNEQIEVIDMTMIDKFSPFLGNHLGFDYEKYAINKEHLTAIAKEHLKPFRRSDSVLHYLPSQYIAEFIKSLGKKGIKYESTADRKGYNIAVFDAVLLDCIEVLPYEIIGITYDR